MPYVLPTPTRSRPHESSVQHRRSHALTHRSGTVSGSSASARDQIRSRVQEARDPLRQASGAPVQCSGAARMRRCASVWHSRCWNVEKRAFAHGNAGLKLGTRSCFLPARMEKWLGIGCRSHPFRRVWRSGSGLVCRSWSPRGGRSGFEDGEVDDGGFACHSFVPGRMRGHYFSLSGVVQHGAVKVVEIEPGHEKSERLELSACAV